MCDNFHFVNDLSFLKEQKRKHLFQQTKIMF